MRKRKQPDQPSAKDAYMERVDAIFAKLNSDEQVNLAMQLADRKNYFVAGVGVGKAMSQQPSQ